MVRFFTTGAEFLRDCADLLARFPLETVFFEANAREMPDMHNGFAARAQDGAADLLAIRNGEYPMVLFGDASLCGALAAALHERGQTFGALLGEKALTERFLACYEALAGGWHRTRFQLCIMRCPVLHDTPTPDVTPAQPQDVEALASLYVRFYAEARGEFLAPEQALEQARNGVGSVYLVRRAGKIAAFAQRCRETQRLCAVSYVYTLPGMRGQGLARRIVTAITRDILAAGKLPYLYVDQKNPVSNHLYRSIGFVYDAPQQEVTYFPARLRLVRPDASHEAQVMAYRAEMLAARSSFDGCAGLGKTEDYAAWLRFEERARARYGDGYVPEDVYLALHREDGRLVGILSFRKRLSEFLLQFGGNIGYSVRPTERRKGYAQEMLGLLLPLCRKEGAERVLVTCDRENEASRKTILAHGGVLENEVPDTPGLCGRGKDGVIQRYWIAL